MVDGEVVQERLKGSAFGHHLRVTATGFLVVVIPLVVVYAIFEKLTTLAQKVLAKIQPGVQELGGPTIALVIFAVVVVFSWGLGWLMLKTELGRRVLAWERTVFTKRSDVLKKVSDMEAKAADEEAKAKVNARPALVHVHGGWQPGILMETSEGGRTGVYVPDLPSVETGRLYCVSDESIIPVDMPNDEFRKALKAHGHGAARWVQILAENGVDDARS